MSRVRVKICGVRTLEEARAALDYGADAVGFNFWPSSPRYIDPEAARTINSRLSPFACAIGVFVNEDARRVREIAAHAGLTAVQLHGDESPAYCAELSGIRIIKAMRVGSDFDLGQVIKYRASAVLLDTSVKGSYGGTGMRFDWHAAVEAKRFAQIILAGGLSVENIGEAISFVRPLAVDVCSSVEAEPGRKDLNKMREFLAEVARANAALAGVD